MSQDYPVIWSMEVFQSNADAWAGGDEVSKHLDCFLKVHKRTVRVEGQKLDIFVHVTRWQRHYNVTIEEERELFWDSTDKIWRTPWGCPNGRCFHGYYAHERFVQPFIERTIAEHFPRRTHYINVDRSFKRRWVYAREGD